MHVTSTTELTVDQVNDRFGALQDQSLVYTTDRPVPKFFLHRAPVTLPAAAEVHVDAPDASTEVVLRLMWGGLPAPFPRAVAAVGCLAALLVLFIAGVGGGAVVVALVLAGSPLLALYYQRLGEQRLQAQLSALIEGTHFVHKPH